MPTRPTIPARGTGTGTSYGCPCGRHVGWADTTTEAIAAIRTCPGKPAPGRPARRTPERNP